MRRLALWFFAFGMVACVGKRSDVELCRLTNAHSEECLRAGKAAMRDGNVVLAKDMVWRACRAGLGEACVLTYEEGKVGGRLRENADDDGMILHVVVSCKDGWHPLCERMAQDLTSKLEPADSAYENTANHLLGLYGFGCDSGNAAVCTRYLRHWKDSLPRLLPSSYSTLGALEERAEQHCNTGNLEACGVRGELWVSHGDPNKGRAVLLPKCRRRDIGACQTLAVMERERDHFEDTLLAAYAVCDLGHTPFCEELAKANLPRPDTSLLLSEEEAAREQAAIEEEKPATEGTTSGDEDEGK